MFVSWHRFFGRHSASPWEPILKADTEAEARREAGKIAKSEDPEVQEDNVVLPEGIEPDGREAA